MPAVLVSTDFLFESRCSLPEHLFVSSLRQTLTLAKPPDVKSRPGQAMPTSHTIAEAAVVEAPGLRRIQTERSH